MGRSEQVRIKMRECRGECRWLLRRVWTWLRYRPLLKCPVCQGAAGSWCPIAYEWDECIECYDHWSETVDCRMRWTEGRVPLVLWLRLKLRVATGHYHIRHWIACRTGSHAWMDESDLEPNLEICARCYEHRYRDQHTPAEQE